MGCIQDTAEYNCIIYKKSQAIYFSERFRRMCKNQKFWKTIKPFLTSKQPSSNNIILKEDDKIKTDEKAICDIFKVYFSHVAMDIGFKDDIPDDIQTADGIARIIDKPSNHPGVTKIKVMGADTQAQLRKTA